MFFFFSFRLYKKNIYTSIPVLQRAAGRAHIQIFPLLIVQRIINRVLVCEI